MPHKKPPAELAVADIWQILDQRVRPLGDERVPLAQAFGRILREDVKADTDQPSFDRSAMDGYALIPGQSRYRVIGTVKAGETAKRAPKKGEALRIFTGAAVPARGLAVLMQEDATVDGEYITVTRRPKVGENVRRRGSDLRKGARLVRSGLYLDAVKLALLASVGHTEPRVVSMPRVVHATTGDEIVAAARVPGPGQIRNSNKELINGFLRALKIEGSHLHHEHWGDDPAAASRRLSSAPFSQADVILISGGASVGEHDYTARILEKAGFRLLVRKAGLRPGRPLIVGFRGRQIVFGLPGNPVSHFVCFQLFVSRALARLRGFPPPPLRRWPLLQPLKDCDNARPTYWPATLEFDRQHRRAAVRILPWNNSGHLAALADAELLAHIPAHTKKLPAGALVDTLLFPLRG